MSTVNFDTSNRTTGGLQRFDCLAWVNFNGTGTVAIRASGNVSSITDNGTGDYTVNFTNALPDAIYSAVCTAWAGSTTNTGLELASPTVTSFRLRTTVSGALGDFANVHAAVFR